MPDLRNPASVRVLITDAADKLNPQPLYLQGSVNGDAGLAAMYVRAAAREKN